MLPFILSPRSMSVLGQVSEVSVVPVAVGGMVTRRKTNAVRAPNSVSGDALGPVSHSATTPPQEEDEAEDETLEGGEGEEEGVADDDPDYVAMNDEPPAKPRAKRARAKDTPVVIVVDDGSQAAKPVEAPPSRIDSALVMIQQMLTVMNANMANLGASVAGLKERTSVLEHKPTSAARQFPPTPGQGVDEYAESDSDPEVNLQLQRLRAAQRKKAAKATLVGKSSIRTDGLAGVEMVEGLKTQPGGDPNSLERTLASRLTLLSLEKPTAYTKIPVFTRVDMCRFARLYDLHYNELTSSGGDIYANTTLEGLASDVVMRYLEAFYDNASSLRAAKELIRPEETGLSALLGTPERLTNFSARLKQQLLLQGAVKGDKPPKT